MMNQALKSHAAMLDALERYFRDTLSIKDATTGRELRVTAVQKPAVPVNDDFETQKRARTLGLTLSKPMVVSLELLEKGKVVDAGKLNLLSIPEPTMRGTYIVGGTEYSFPIQKRLLPGVYTTKKEDGSVASWLNTAEGRSYTVTMRPKGDFILEVQNTGGSTGLLGVLVGLGVPPAAISAAWGPDVMAANKGAAEPLASLKWLFERLHHTNDAPVESETAQGYAAWISAYWEGRTAFPDEENVAITTGKPASKVNARLLFDISMRCIEVFRDLKEQDNKEDMRHAKFSDIGDFAIERLRDREYRGTIQRKLALGLRKSNKIGEVVGRDVFQSVFNSTWTKTSVSRSPKQTSPMDMISGATEVTVRGEGGIQTEQAITKDVRALDPSHLGFFDPVHTPEGSNIGTTMHMAVATRKRGDQLETQVIDVKTGQPVWVNPRQFYAVPVAFADYFKDGKLTPGPDGRVEVMYRHRETSVYPREVVYAMKHTTDMFNVNALAIPGLGHNNGTRAMTASKMQTQAKSLLNPEAPLVQCARNEVGDGMTVEQAVGIAFCPKSPIDGTVTKVTETAITIQGAAGQKEVVQVPKDFWLNESNFVDGKPIVAVGDKVKAGQPIADTNYTRNGTLAQGTNMRVAYVAWRGYNHEDGVVISEEAAGKLTSVHAHQTPVPIGPDEVSNKAKWRAYFPTLFSQDQLTKLDDDGVIQKGQRVNPGDPLVVKMRKNQEEVTSKQLKAISRTLASDFRDTSVVFEKDHAGVVAEVTKRRGEIFLVIKTEERARVGDKIVGRYGNKGTITQILPDDKMPKDEENRVLHVLINPSGVPARMNMGQIHETNAARIAEKSGKPYVMKPFGENNTDRVLGDLAANKMSDASRIYDPDENEWIDGLTVGTQYMFKLEHQVEKKLSARGAGEDEVYSLSGQPSSGGGTGGRALGLGELYALLSHGAKHSLREMYTFKGDQSPEAWRAIEMGYPVPPPEMPSSSVRFVGMLRGMGVNLEEKGNMVKMTPFLDRDVRKVSAGEVKLPGVLRAQDLKEESGGLFDLKLTGGLTGEKWTHIELVEPMPHPTFERAILDLTRIKEDDYDAIIRGDKGVKAGQVVAGDAEGALTGGRGIEALLAGIDVERRLGDAEREAQRAKGSDLNKLNREMRTLRNLRDNGVSPQELVVKTVPIIPPKFRPVAELPGGDLTIADVNEHYRSLILMNNMLRTYEGRPGLAEDRKRLVSSLQEGMRGVMGFSTGLVGKPNVKGLSATIAGSQPKHGWYGSKLLRRRQDGSGTAVVEPDPKLGMDEIGVPEEMAWTIYSNHIVRNLTSMGIGRLEAKTMIEKRQPAARKALELAMDQRMVYANRAPTLHRWSMMAFKGRLVPGSAIKLPVEVLTGYNADFDGDTFGIHVTATEESSREAQDFVPSKNLYAPGRQRQSMVPQLTQEFILGLYTMTKPGVTTSKTFASAEQVENALKARQVKANDVVSLRGVGRTTPGLVLAMKMVPADLRDYMTPLDKKQVSKLLIDTEKKHGTKAFTALMEHLKVLGGRYVSTMGNSVLLSDMRALSKDRQQLYLKADRDAEAIRRDARIPKDEQERRIIAIYQAVDSKMLKLVETLPANSAGRTNNLTNMVVSGARGNPHQVKQIVGSVGLMLDHKQQILPQPVRGNYSEGLTSAGFWLHSYSQRKGMIDRSQSVIGPGALSKELTNTASRYAITVNDCKTTSGRMEPIDRHLLHRALARPAANFPRNTLIDDAVYKKLTLSGLKEVMIRSPLTCEAPDGLCAMCFGIDETGRLPNVGKQIGISEIQTITERSIQLPMKSFHSGGVASAEGGLSDAFSRAVQILRMPDQIRGKAVLAPVMGRVEKISARPMGGWDIVVAGKQVSAPKGIDPVVKVGDIVRVGDKLTQGVIKPQELLELKGIGAVQGQVRDDLHATFAAADVKLHKRTYEVMTRGLTDTVRVTSPGDSKEFVTGDYTSLAKVQGWNKANPGKRPVVYQAELAGSLMAPKRTNDWAQRMALGGIQQTLQEGAAMGYESERKPSASFADIALGPGTKIRPAGEEFIKKRW